MQLVSTGSEHRISNEATRLAILGRVVVGDDTVFLNRFRRNTGYTTSDGGSSATLALIVIVVTLNQEISHATSRSVDSGAAGAAVEGVRHRTRHEVEKFIRIPVFKRKILPGGLIQQR